MMTVLVLALVRSDLLASRYFADPATINRCVPRRSQMK
jgi:hypothetical protein